MKTTIKTLYTPWEDMPPWSAGIACIAASERVWPVIDRLALKRTATSCRQILDELWASAATMSFDPKHQSSLVAFIKSFPESAEDDSHKPSFYAMRAIGILWHAVKSTDIRMAHQELRGVVAELLGFTADLDFLMRRAQMPDHSLKEAEIAYENNLYHLLKQSNREPLDVADTSREIAVEDSIKYRRTIDQIARTKGW